MSMYLIADITVTDPKMYASYVEQARPIVEAAGGKYLVTGGDPWCLAGTWTPERMVIIEFPSKEALDKCFSSPDYHKIATLRLNSTTSKAILVKGCDEE